MGTELNDVCKITGWNEAFVDELSFGLNECGEFWNQKDYAGWPVIDLPTSKHPFIKIDNQYYCFDYYSLSAQFSGNGRQGQNVVVLVHYLFSGILLMPNADLVVTALVNQQVILEGRFCVAALYTGREAVVGCFDVAIAVVNTDDVNSVFVFHLFLPFII